MVDKVIGAIETHYKGYRFRSRLEARWAVFFDAMGIEWKYEVEGYEKDISIQLECTDDDIDETHYPPKDIFRYLPDFYLPTFNGKGIWCEVKGYLDCNYAQRLGEFLDFECPLPYFTNTIQEQAGYIILGEIPLPVHGFHLHKYISHKRGLNLQWFMFNHKKQSEINPIKIFNVHETSILRYFYKCRDNLYNDYYDSTAADLDDAKNFFNPESHVIPSYWAYGETQDAYQAARSARFEHGERP